MQRAKIIVIEGTDGSGKETQSLNLFNYYKEKNMKVKRYSFPIYDSPTGKILGGPYLGKEEICKTYFQETSANVDPIVSILYFAADRRYNLLKEIEKEIYSNDIIILDRYTTSNMGHQVGKAKNDKDAMKILKVIETLEFELCELPKPDLVVFLHMPFEATRDMRKTRKSGDGNENSESHLRGAEKAYVKIAKLKKWDYIDCLKEKTYKSIDDIKNKEEIFNEIINLVNKNKKTLNAIERMTRFNE